jgi:hypothetical protein
MFTIKNNRDANQKWGACRLLIELKIILELNSREIWHVL